MITALDKKTALIVIDLQKGVVKNSSSELTGPVVANAARLAAAFRKLGLPVVLVNVNPVGAPWTLVRATPTLGVYIRVFDEVVVELVPLVPTNWNVS